MLARPFVAIFVALAGVAALSCSDDSAADPSPAGGASGASTMSPGAAGAAGATTAPVIDPRCVAPGGVSNAPRSIDQVVTLVNALPHPLSLPCFLQSLAKPFAVQLTSSVLSQQPSDGKRSPRTFLFFEPLIMSVVPSGKGAPLLELGERSSDTDSIKAEIEFPVATPLTATSPFDRLRFSDEASPTSCGFCHASEAAVEGIAHPFARTSQALRPVPNLRIRVDAMNAEAASCDSDAEPERCAMLRVIYDPAQPPVEHEFPAEYKTFF